MTIRDRLDQLFDFPILSHRFAPFQRDYLIESEIGGSGPNRGRYLFTFTHCPVANLTTTIRDESWKQAWDDRFISYQGWLTAGEPEGYVWGVNWSMAYPGPSYIDGSPVAAEWSQRLGHEMHEALIETEAFRLQLVFHDLRVERTGDEVSVYDKVTFPVH